MHRGSSDVPQSLKPPSNTPQQYCGWPQKHAYGKAGYGRSGDIPDSRIAVVLATLHKMTFKWPIWLQAKMMRATLSGLSKGICYGCALGTIVGVEAGYSHTVADMTCTQVTMYTAVKITVPHAGAVCACLYVSTGQLTSPCAEPQKVALGTLAL